MKQIKFIISIFLKNKIKDYFFYTIIAFSIIFGIFLFFSHLFFIGEKNKVFIDFGIAGINFILLISSIYFSTEILPEIRKNNFIHWILSLPLNKKYIFLGSFLYILILLFIVWILYCGIYFLFFPVLKINFSEVFFYYFLLCFVKFVLLSIIGLIITIKYNTFTGILSLISIYFIGSYTFNFLQFLINKGYVNFIKVGKIIYYFFPDFGLSALTARVSHYVSLDLFIILKSIIYYFSYSLILLILGVFIFEKKEV